MRDVATTKEYLLILKIFHRTPGRDNQEIFFYSEGIPPSYVFLVGETFRQTCHTVVNLHLNSYDTTRKRRRGGKGIGFP